MKKLIIIILLIPSLSFAQTKDELDLCMAIQANSFSTNAEADDALERILNVIGASKNFVLTPCDKISNAVATAYKGTRYILYDKEFMNQISKNTNDWSNLFIFAHEVGHHINGHSIDLLLFTNDVVDTPSLEKSRKQELEADEFAAFVLAKLGANLSQLNNVITLISDNSDDTYSTHPKRDKRLASVKVGFNKGFEKLNSGGTNDMETLPNTVNYKKYPLYSWVREEFSPLDYHIKEFNIVDPFEIKKAERTEAASKIWASVEGNHLSENIIFDKKIRFRVQIHQFTSNGGIAAEILDDSNKFFRENLPYLKFGLQLEGSNYTYGKLKSLNSSEFCCEREHNSFIDTKILIDNTPFNFISRINISNSRPVGSEIKDEGKTYSKSIDDKSNAYINISFFLIEQGLPELYSNFNNDIYNYYLSFISALKSGKKLFIQLDNYDENGFQYFDKKITFQFSLSGSSKALAY